MEKNSKHIGGVTLVNNLKLDPEKSTLPLQFMGDRVLIEPIPPDKYLSEKAKLLRPANFVEPFYRGIIMNVGGSEYGQNIPPSLKPGIIVNYYHQSALDWTIEGDDKKYHLVRSSDVFAIL